MKSKYTIQSIKSAIYKYSLNIFGLGAVCFIFEACYGTPPVEYSLKKEIQFKGQIKSFDNNQPIKSINVNVITSESNISTTTNEFGEFIFDLSLAKTEEFEILFSDIDNLENGSFKDKIINLNESDLKQSQKITELYLDSK